MTSLLERLHTVDPRSELFRDDEHLIDALTLRATLARTVHDLQTSNARFVLVCRSAALQLVGLLTAAVLNRQVLLPAHDASGYLAEFGLEDSLLLADRKLDGERCYRLTLADGPSALPPPINSGDPELVFFTSGSTGAPKPVTKPLSCLEAEAATLARLWPLPDGCAIEGTVSHQHIYGLLYRVVLPVIAGHVGRSLPVDYWEQLADRLDDRTVLVTSPAHLTRLPDGLPWERMHPALIFSSTAPLPFAAANAAAERLGRLPIEVYGSTETGGIAWRRQTMADTPWTSLPGVELSVEPPDDALVRSPFIGSDQSFRLADRIEPLPEGRFHLLGRLDRVVKVEGKRVSLPRVEQALLAIDGVVEAAVVDLPDRQGALGAVILLDEAAGADLDRLGHFRFSRQLRAVHMARLEPAERPKWWRFPAALPRDRQGKRPVDALRRLFAGEPDRLPPHRLIAATDQVAEIALDLAPDLIWFSGHFPDKPILAGVVQIHLSRLFAERLWQVPPLPSDLAMVKFRRLITAGDAVSLHLERVPDKAAIRFRYEINADTASQGQIGES